MTEIKNAITPIPEDRGGKLPVRRCGYAECYEFSAKAERERIEDLVPTIAAALTEHLRQSPARSKHATTKAFEAIIFAAVQR